MLAPRWHKVIGDLWGNKTRTLLVVLSIAIGVFAIGMVTGGREILVRDVNGDWNAANPPSASIGAENIDQDLIAVIRRMPGIADAQPSQSTLVRAQTPSGEQKDLLLTVVRDVKDIHMYVPTPLSGQWPPERRSIVLERSALPFLEAHEGDQLRIETRKGDKYTFGVGGTVYNIGSGFPTSLINIGYGYISGETADLLGLPASYNSVQILVAENRADKQHVRAIAEQVEQKIKNSGRATGGISINDTPGLHPADSFIQSFTLLLSVVGFFALLLSAFLVINTTGALLTQQIKQIGVMKSIGARTWDIVQLYLVTVLAFGLLSLLVAIPLGVFGAWLLASFFISLLNFNISTIAPTPNVLSQQIAAGLIIPMVSALFPIFSGTRVTVREALGGPGLGKGRFGRSRIDKLIGRIKLLSRPMLLSLRNTFRRKGRLALTLTTLTLAGTIFMAVICEQASLNTTVDNVFAQLNTDVFIYLDRPYRTAAIDRLAALPDVTTVECWDSYSALVLDSDERESTKTYGVSSLPADSQSIKVGISEGRWLLPTDESAVVLTSNYLKDYPHAQVGDQVRLKLNDKKLTMTVVGISRVPFPFSDMYVNLASISRQMGSAGRASEVRLITKVHDLATQTRVSTEAIELLKSASVQVTITRTLTAYRASNNITIDMTIYFLLLMAVLMAAVGGLGLMGTMSINVLERTREIGVMRAIGAGNWAIQRIVIAEGILIGAISWVIGAILAVPIAYGMNVGLAATYQSKDGFTFVFAPSGVLLWLGIVLVLATLASALPAWNASRVTVRDVLAYE
jgi:putative ABC transport system permease protein